MLKILGLFGVILVFSLKTLMEISVIYFTVHRILMDRYKYSMIGYICVDMNEKFWGK